MLCSITTVKIKHLALFETDHDHKTLIEILIQIDLLNKFSKEVRHE